VRLSVSADEFGVVSVAGWDPGGRWVLFWNTYPDSESLNEDGSPLRAVNLATGEVTTITDYGGIHLTGPAQVRGLSMVGWPAGGRGWAGDPSRPAPRVGVPWAVG